MTESIICTKVMDSQMPSESEQVTLRRTRTRRSGHRLP